MAMNSSARDSALVNGGSRALGGFMSLVGKDATKPSATEKKQSFLKGKAERSVCGLMVIGGDVGFSTAGYLLPNENITIFRRSQHACHPSIDDTIR
jgi:hypothetical protein